MTPLVSVVLCSYNQARYVEEAVESVLGQTFPDWELLIVDNGSTDGTPGKLERYRAHPRVRLFLHRENQAVTRRLNEAIAASRGDLISLLYSDDYYLPRKLERQVESFMKLGADYGVVYSPGYRLDVRTGARVLDPSPRVSGDVLEPLLRGGGSFINPISPLVRRACFTRYPFQEDLFIEGESINLRFAMTFKFFYLDEPLVVMREHDANIGKDIQANVERLMQVLDRLEHHPDLPPASRPAVAVFRARVLRDAGWQGVRVIGDVAWARDCWRRAAASHRAVRFHPRVVAGRALAFLPERWRALLNAIGHRLRGHSGIDRLERRDLEAG